MAVSSYHIISDPADHCLFLPQDRKLALSPPRLSRLPMSPCRWIPLASLADLLRHRPRLRCSSRCRLLSRPSLRPRSRFKLLLRRAQRLVASKLPVPPLPSRPAMGLGPTTTSTPRTIAILTVARRRRHISAPVRCPCIVKVKTSGFMSPGASRLPHPQRAKLAKESNLPRRTVSQAIRCPSLAYRHALG
jgi:hypothetical protein